MTNPFLDYTLGGALMLAIVLRVLAEQVRSVLPVSRFARFYYLLDAIPSALILGFWGYVAPSFGAQPHDLTLVVWSILGSGFITHTLYETVMQTLREHDTRIRTSEHLARRFRMIDGTKARNAKRPTREDRDDLRDDSGDGPGGV